VSGQAAFLDLVETMSPIALDELDASAALRTRVDRKYVVDWAMLEEVATGLAISHRALNIDGRRAFTYDSVYFDSPELWSYRAHIQQRRRRYKARSRRYVETDRHMFEVKLKGNRGETIKRQLPYRPDDHGRLTDEARAFLPECLRATYPGVELPELAPTLRTRYRRTTFAHASERVTIDFDLTFQTHREERLGLAPGYAILESKSEHGVGEADRTLRRLGVRPIACSKYCVGVGLLREDAKVNELRWLLKRYFTRPTLSEGRTALAHG